MTDWERALKFVGISEGGRNFDIVNGKPVLNAKNKNDAGGPTAYGITHGTLSAAYKQGLVGHNDITKLTKAEADKIYEVRYWQASHADEMQWPLNLCHFDWSVNAGVSQAGKTLQKSLNKIGEKLACDGVVGQKTLAAIKQHDIKEICRIQLAERLNFYNNLCERKPGNKNFLGGWVRRVSNLEKEVEKFNG